MSRLSFLLKRFRSPIGYAPFDVVFQPIGNVLPSVENLPTRLDIGRTPAFDAPIDQGGVLDPEHLGDILGCQELRRVNHIRFGAGLHT